MRILGVDTSTSKLAAAITDGGKTIAGSRPAGRPRHSSILVPTVERLLKRARLNLEDIDLFAVGLGPGSFTGLRVGVTAMRAFALAAGKPIVGVPSLDAIAYNACKKGAGRRGTPLPEPLPLVCPLLDAKQQQVYACFYRIEGGKLKKASPYLLENVEKLCGRIKSPVHFLGDGIALYRDRIEGRVKAGVSFRDSDDWQPGGDVIARLAMERYGAGQRDDAYDLVPLYLYSRECHILKKRKR